MTEHGTDHIIPFLDTNSLSDTTAESLERMSLSARLKEYDGLQDFMHATIDDPELIDEFEVDGYIDNYTDRENGFFEFGSRNRVLYDVLNELTEKGSDTRRAWEVFAQISKEVWQCAPQIYKISDTKVETPLDYDPDNPFPQHSLKEHLRDNT